MSDEYYLGELALFASERVPEGWLPCDGQRLAVSQFQSLFAVIGFTFGGDGQYRFDLPDLRGRVPMGAGRGPGLRRRALGEVAGRAAVSLETEDLPPHRHVLHQAAPDAPAEPDGVPAVDARRVTPSEASKSGATIERTGEGAPIELTPPALVMTWCICVDGAFPVPEPSAVSGSR